MYVCGLRGWSARGQGLYPDSVAGAQPKPGPCAVVVVAGDQGSTIPAKTLSIRYYTYYIILRINTVSITEHGYARAASVDVPYLYNTYKCH